MPGVPMGSMGDTGVGSLGKNDVKLLKTEGPVTAGLHELWVAQVTCAKENPTVSTCWCNSSCAAEVDTSITVGRP